MKKSLTKQLKIKKDEIKELKLINQKIIEDRKKFREFYIRIMKEVLKIHSGENGISTEWYLKENAKLLNNVENWYWY